MNSGPVFNARLVSGVSFDTLYRVYAVDDRLYFIRVGGQGGFWEELARPLGFFGLLVESSVKKRAEKKGKALIEAIDRTSPEQLLPAHADNFRLEAAELSEATVDPPSFFATHGPHVGRCQLTLRDGRKMSFQFEAAGDMRTAMDVLSDLIPSGFQVNVRWNDSKKRYEKRDDAAVPA